MYLDKSADSLRFQPELRATIAGVEGLIQTTADTNYDVVLQIDNNNAGWLEAAATTGEAAE